jgi:signal transduction histidine kinase
MLINLMLNAIEASPPGTTIEVMATRDRERVRISVLDRGPGLDGDMLSRAPELGVSTKPDGLGLGLTIARLLARQHCGTLELRNRDGGGLVAEIQLPLVSPSEVETWRSVPTRVPAEREDA